MGLFDTQTKELNSAVVALKTEIAELKASREAAEKRLALADEAVKLKQQIEDLKIQAARITEDNAREKREVQHMVGLERKRQEFEAEQARKGIETARQDAVLGVREENLKAERKAFDDQMRFRQEQFDNQVDYLKGMVEQILERLPTVTVDRQITDVATTKTTRSSS